MTGSPVPAPPRPMTLRVFPVVAALRVVVTGVVLIGTVLEIPRITRGFQVRFDTRLDEVFGGVQTGSRSTDTSAVVGGVFGGIVGGLVALVALAGWALLAWFAFRGARWGAIGVAVLSSLAALTSLLLPVFVLAGFDYPSWLLVLSAVTAVVDLAVVALLVLPSSRQWFAAVPPAPVPTTTGPPGYGLPDPGRRH